MFAHERYEIILELLYRNKVVKAAELAERFKVSIETIRRDLEYLEKQGNLQRVYGGAALNKHIGVEIEYSSRETRNLDEKKEIGKKAAELIENGDTVILDLGTTCLEVARNLRNRENLTVITNSIKIATELVDVIGIRVFLMGGLIRGKELASSGFLTENGLKQFNVDKAIISVGGITIDNGITDYHVEEAQARKVMIDAAEQVIAVTDYSKFGSRAFIKVCDLNSIDTIVTDWQTPMGIIKNYENEGMNMIVALKE